MRHASFYTSLLCVSLGVLPGCRTTRQTPREDQKTPQAQNPRTVGGVNDGNTGELATTKSNPWFVGAAPATYCVQFGDGSAVKGDPTAQAAVVQQVDKAFAAWVDILNVLRPLSPGQTGAPNGEFLAGDAVANLTRAFKRVECADNPDMRIKIGTWEQEDQDYLKYTSRYTVAYALRTVYSEETGRSRGFIWLVPDSGDARYKGPAPEGAFWSSESYVYNVLLHEIGHTFGLPHVSNSFMDASFPAGVLASKLGTAWAPGDFKSLVGIDSEQCGELYRLADDPDLVILKDVFGVEPAAVNKICWRPANELRGDRDNTPLLFTLKDKKDKQIAEQLFDLDGAYGETASIGGNYLKKVGDGEYRYSTVTHVYYSPRDLFRMNFARNARHHWVEAEIASPGMVAFRFAYEGSWKTLGALQMPMARFVELNKAIQAASFEEDSVTDD